MKFLDRCPHWATLPTEQLLKQVGFDVLSQLMPRIADWYRVQLPLWAVLYHLGYDGTHDTRGGPRHPLIGPSTLEEQVSCMLPDHGGDDVKPSARYYLTDRNENTQYGHIYCFGPHCQKPYTSFWYLYAMLKFHRNAKYRDVILYIESVFQVAFPRHILLNSDPDLLGEAEQEQAKQLEMAQRFVQARLLRERLRPVDPGQYLAALATLYTQPLVCAEVAP